MPAGIKIKELFFDRKKVIDAVGAASARVLSQAGAFVMTKARQSMKYRKRYATAGEPPSAHFNPRTKAGNPLLRRMLFFSFDPHTKSVVIGPIKLGRSIVPRLMEEGGTIQQKARVHGKPVTRPAHYRKHPYMAPALKEELPRLPKRWSGSVRT